MEREEGGEWRMKRMMLPARLLPPPADVVALLMTSRRFTPAAARAAMLQLAYIDSSISLGMRPTLD